MTLLEKLLRQKIFSAEERQEVYVVSDFEGRAVANEWALDKIAETEENFFKIADQIYHRARWINLLDCWGAADERECSKAIIRRDGHKILITGGQAANALHLTTQVQARIVYITDGPSRIERITTGRGGWSIEFQHADNDVMFWAGHPGAIVIQALRWMGEPCVNAHRDEFTHQLRESSWKNNTIPAPVKKDLQDNMAQVPEWMQPIIQDVVNNDCP